MDKVLELIRRLVPKSSALISIAILVIAVIAFVWYKFGPVPAIVLIVGVLLIWGAVQVYNLVIKKNEQKKGKEFNKAIGASREEINQATSQWDSKWKEALKTLDDSKKGLYQLPWYMLVGEPQSGKSTTLHYSGLNFPLGKSAIEGGGGTRNCDWWFTNEGVILDTAGRLTMHQQATTDQAEWNHFLSLLGKFRPYCPINGVILVIPVDALLKDSPEERTQKAKTIRERLSNIQKRLAVQFPVYVVITKCDLIYGFTHFFDKLDPHQQREMFGWSMDGEGKGFASEIFRDSFNELVDRVDQQRKMILAKPSVRENREKIYLFPEEFARIKDPLSDYLSFIFEDHIYADVPFFRGFYFTSGMQEGTPILSACEKLMPGDAQMSRLETLFKQQRAFFIRDFYKDKVLPEQGLVQRAAHLLKRDKNKRRMVWGVQILFLLLGTFFIYQTYSKLNQQLNQPKEAIKEAKVNFNKAEGHFFDTDKSNRELIFRSLINLKKGVGSVEGVGLISSSNNRMTEYLENTFTYFFIDRVMLGMFAEVNEQLDRFAMEAPPSPRNSQHELKVLLDALNELKTWKLQVAKDQPLEFTPDIKPFLALSLKPEWNDDLAQYRDGKTLSDQFQEWFKTAYEKSTPEVRTQLITAIVNRTEQLFIGLEKQVEDFYVNQPELKLYQEKVAKAHTIERRFEAILSLPTDASSYATQLNDLHAEFDADFTKLRDNKADVYLSFDEVRTQVLDALGPAFLSLQQQRQNAESVVDFDRNERDHLPKIVEFSDVLLAVDAEALPNPRAQVEPDRDQHFVFNDNHIQFNRLILTPFFETFPVGQDPYKQLNDPERTMRANIGRIFELGGKRFYTLRNVFENQLFQFSDRLEGTDKNRLERVMNTFKNQLTDIEYEKVTDLLNTVVRSQEPLVPEPPSSWKQLVDSFNELSRQKPQHGAFMEHPQALQTLLENDYLQEQSLIFGRNNKFTEQLLGYHKNATSALDRFVAEINALDRISRRELANNKSLYSNRFPGYENVEGLQTIDPTPLMFEPHAEALAQWSIMAIAAFREYVLGSNPCPECGPTVNKVKEVVEPVITTFPLTFSNTITLQDQPGKLTVQANFTPQEKLDAVLEALEPFREPNDLLSNYLKRRKLDDFFENAVAWADAVRGMREENTQLTLFFEVPTSENTANRQASLGSNVTFAKLEGYFKLGRGIMIRVPTTTAPVPLVADGNAQLTQSIFNFGNEEQTGDNEAAAVYVNDSFMGLMAFMLSGQPVNRSRFHRPVTLTLNTGKKVEVTFQFNTDRSVPPPPQWSEILR